MRGLHRSGVIGALLLAVAVAGLGVSSQRASATAPGVAVAAGGMHSMVVLADGSLWGFGALAGGQVGVPGAVGEFTTTPLKVNFPLPVKAVAAARLSGFGRTNHTLAVLSDGSVWAFGSNSHGQLGFLPNNNANNLPRKVEGLSDVVAVSAGPLYSMALKSDGTVWEFGFNSFGRFGTNASADTIHIPTQAVSLPPMKSITAGPADRYAVAVDGTLWAVGDNTYNLLGIPGPPLTSNGPVQVPGLTSIVAVAAGERHTLALAADGSVWGFGYNHLDQALGFGSGLYSTPAVKLPNLNSVIAVGAGHGYSIFLMRDGTIWGMGNNHGGGLGSRTKYWTPFADPLPLSRIEGLTSVTSLSVGDDHTLVTRADGSVWGFGFNGSGRLARTDNAGVLPVPEADPRPAPILFGAAAAGSVTELVVAGRGGVPVDATAVVLNVAVTEAQAPGFVTVWPCGSPLPTAANLNYSTGDTIPNAVIAKVGDGGKVCLYTMAGTHLVVDVNGYFPAGASYNPLIPQRFLDTRE